MRSNKLIQFLSRHPHLVLPLVIYCIHALYYSGWTLDDPYISYRYAENLAEGRGLVFNPGERVEGYSNFLFVLLLAGAHLGRFDIVDASRVAGFASAILLISVFYVFLRKRAEEPRSILSYLALYLLALNGSFAMWSVSGLETTFFALWGVLGWIFLCEATKRGYLLSSFFLLLAALSRPDGLLFFGGCLLFVIYKIVKGEENPLNVLLWLMMFLVPYALYSVWRLEYYGSLLSNTFLAKATGEPRFQLLAGLEYAARFFLTNGSVLFLFCLLPLLAGFSTMRREANLAALIVIVYLGFIVGVGGDWMPQFRFFVPILPLLFFLMQEGFRQFWQAVRVHDPVFRTRDLVVLIILVILFVDIYYERKDTRLWVYSTRTGTLYQSHVQLGKWMSALLPPGSVVAGAEAGIIPFYSHLRFIDILGIIDPHVARLKGGLHQKWDVNYVLDRQPDYILLHAHVQTKPDSTLVGYYPWDIAMFASDRFWQHYTLLRRVERGNDLYGKNLILLYQRKKA
jgi:arabinofuranosyltransferase